MIVIATATVTDTERVTAKATSTVIATVIVTETLFYGYRSVNRV